MPRFVGHRQVDQAVALTIVVKFCTWKRVCDRDLNGFSVESLRKINRPAKCLPCFAGQPDDEVPMDHQPQLLAILSESERHLDGRALLDVLEDLRVTGFISNN